MLNLIRLVNKNIVDFFIIIIIRKLKNFQFFEFFEFFEFDYIFNYF